MSENGTVLLTEKRKEFLRYLVGCGGNLLLKMVISSLLNLAGICMEVAYLLTQIIILFCSFFYHHFITFQRRSFGGWGLLLKEFLHYSLVVIGLFALDYCLVVLGIRFVEKHWLSNLSSEIMRQLFHWAMILCSSGFIFILRFFFYRVVFKKKKT